MLYLLKLEENNLSEQEVLKTSSFSDIINQLVIDNESKHSNDIRNNVLISFVNRGYFVLPSGKYKIEQSN